MARIVWTRQSREDLAAIKAYIAGDAPRTAEAFTRRLMNKTRRLRRFPWSGSVVQELNRPAIREILFGSYRIIYRASNKLVEILTVYHGTRLLDDSQFPDLD
ncbi:MAG: type II toxin-antitoxin system RelE/ParE family toxin [Planctomycetes bacterium]|nr:type II toxin-antitoxin system RelE/ParE family toxin [Planctomycetota bacterium]